MRIEYAPHFKKVFHNMFECNEELYGKTLLRNLFESIKSSRELLASNPYAGSIEPTLDNLNKDYRRLVIHKYIKLIYYVENDTIFYIDLWDTRQSTDTLKSRIN